MKFSIILLSLLVLGGCGKKESNDKDSPAVEKNIVEALSPEQINEVCGQGTRGMSIIGAWKLAVREVDGVYPKMLINFDFNQNGKVEIGLSCRVSHEEIRATYNHKMVRTDYTVESSMIMFNHHAPIEFSVSAGDGANCRLDDLAGTYKLDVQGECLTINLKGNTLYMVRD